MNEQEFLDLKTKAESGDIDAMQDLANRFYGSDGPYKDYSQAYYWYKKSAEGGNVIAMSNLGNWCYVCGNGVEKNVAEGISWLTKAADTGNVWSMNKLASIYVNEEGFKDLCKAFHYYKLAALQGDLNSIENLGGFCYLYGIGIEKNVEAAFDWLSLAINLGADDEWTKERFQKAFDIIGKIDRNKSIEYINTTLASPQSLSEKSLFGQVYIVSDLAVESFNKERKRREEEEERKRREEEERKHREEEERKRREKEERIAHALKLHNPHPWDALDANLKVRDKIHGKVVEKIIFAGALVEVRKGVVGFVDDSEMSIWGGLFHPEVGDEIDAVILTLDRDERKMLLSIKQIIADLWETIDIDTKYAVGSRHFAKVRNITTYGVFVEIEEGVEGFIHITDWSWTKIIKYLYEITSIGAEIEVVVLDIDKENRRLSLGHKQLEENPWEELEAKFGVDTIIEGKVVELNDKGAVVSMEEGVEGFCTTRHLQKEDKSQVAVGDTLNFKVIEFNRDAKRILLSHLRTWE